MYYGYSHRADMTDTRTRTVSFSTILNNDTTGTATYWPYHNGYLYRDCFVYAGTSTIYCPDILAHPRKNWRWYDVFRTFAPPRRMPLRLLPASPPLRVQERHPRHLRARQKRRAFVQKLRSTPTQRHSAHG